MVAVVVGQFGCGGRIRRRGKCRGRKKFDSVKVIQRERGHGIFKAKGDENDGKLGITRNGMCKRRRERKEKWNGGVGRMRMPKRKG